jgi:hypothetical protein
MNGSTIVLIGAAGAALLFMSGRKDGEGGTGGSLDIPALFGTGNIGGDPVTSQPAPVAPIMPTQYMLDMMYRQNVEPKKAVTPIITSNSVPALTDYGTGKSIVPTVNLFAPQNMNLDASGKPNPISQGFLTLAQSLNTQGKITQAAARMTLDKGTGKSIVSIPSLFGSSSGSSSSSSSSKKAATTTVQTNPGSNTAPSYGKGWM